MTKNKTALTAEEIIDKHLSGLKTLENAKGFILSAMQEFASLQTQSIVEEKDKEIAELKRKNFIREELNNELTVLSTKYAIEIESQQKEIEELKAEKESILEMFNNRTEIILELQNKLDIAVKSNWIEDDSLLTPTKEERKEGEIETLTVCQHDWQSIFHNDLHVGEVCVNCKNLRK